MTAVITVNEIKTKIKTCIINSLELELTCDDIPDQASLFASFDEGGIELDSLAALTIIVAISQEFNITITEAPPEVFESVDTLATFVLQQIQSQT
jgi:acyl carrier protein